MHLHTHSYFSVSDALPSPDALCRAASGGTLALTDHNTLGGAVAFTKACNKHDVHGILGAELDLKDGGRLVFLVKDRTGYHHLIDLVRHAPPTLDQIEACSEGLIALSSDTTGLINRHILDKDQDATRRACDWARRVFGDDFYLEHIDHGLREQAVINRILPRISKAFGFEIVHTNDVHYVSREDADAHFLGLCDAHNRHVTPEVMDMTRPRGAWLCPLECEVAASIAEQCTFTLEMNADPQLPSFPVPESFETTRADHYLWSQSKKGLEKRLKGRGGTKAYVRQLRHEFKVVCDMGYEGYFLIVADFVQWCHDKGIPVGPGRGSGAGSVMAWALEITDVDPLKYGLIFERFLNPDRVSMPDFDIDFCQHRRREVMEYVRRKYGRDRCASIVTYGKRKAKAAFDNAAAAFGISVDREKWIKRVHFPDDDELESLKAHRDNGGFDRLFDEWPHYEQVIDLAVGIEGSMRDRGKHAAGVIISDKPVWEHAPVREDGDIYDWMVEYGKEEAEEVGLVKFDFLGLVELSVIGRTESAIGCVPDYDESDEVYEMLARGHTHACFQAGGDGFARMCQSLKPSQFEHLIAAVALYRPGPKESGMIEKYIDRMHGREKVSYPHADLEAILKDTYGIIVYQEQVMEIAQAIAGYSMGQADILRRAMGKKKAKVMAAQKDVFRDKARERGYSAELVDELWALIETFAEYGFNRAHATSYAKILYQTAYLKCHHTAAYLASYMQERRSDFDAVVDTIFEARRMGVDIVDPDVQSPSELFSSDGQVITIGLTALKSVKQDALERIVDQAPYDALGDFLGRTHVDKATLVGLAKSGALDGLLEVEGLEEAALWRKAVCEQAGRLSKSSRAQDTDQAALFSLSETGVTLEQPEYPWGTLECLEYEYAVLGRFRTDHPARIVREHGYPTLDAWREAETMDPFQCTAVIVDISAITTKKGDPMAFLTIEDETRREDVTVFPDDWDPAVFDEGMLCRFLLRPNEYDGSISLLYQTHGDP